MRHGRETKLAKIEARLADLRIPTDFDPDSEYSRLSEIRHRTRDALIRNQYGCIDYEWVDGDAEFVAEYLNLEQQPLPDVFCAGLGHRPDVVVGEVPVDLEGFIAEAGRFLLGLPFVPFDQIEWDRDADTLSIEFIGAPSFPLERVICVESFGSWAGRMNEGKKISNLEVFPFGEESFGKICAYAHWPEATLSYSGGATLNVAVDASGDHWAVATVDGSHRLGAQKLRGDSLAHVCELRIYSDETGPYIPFGVRERFGAAQR